MNCRGCGGTIEEQWDGLGGFFGYGNAFVEVPHEVEKLADEKVSTADYTHPLCPKCTRVMKDILLNSDLSDHWEEDDEG